MELRDYQLKLVNQALEKLKTVDRLCLQLATGGGKTVIFSHIAKNYYGRVLILVDSAELVQQTSKTIQGSGTFEAKDKQFPGNKIVVAMSQTIWSRSKKDVNIIYDFDLLIVDEAHVWVHNKNFTLCKYGCKILGVTATPVRSKRITFIGDNDIEYVRDELMSDVYQDIVVGVGISDLIKQGYLVDEDHFVIDVDTSKLKTDNSGEFTNESINDVFNNEKYTIDILQIYESVCLNKKTMVFTPNTSVNKNIFELFQQKGYSCVMYDSVNSNKNEREGIVNWFKNTPKAILFNVSVFTKGFDVTDVEAIIMARPTASLSLFIQIVGRGSRPTKNIYKDCFIHIDGGGNAERFGGSWSSSHRDWNKIFFNGLKPIKKKSEEPLEETKDCPQCDATIPKKSIECEYCGYEYPVKEKKDIEPNIEKVIRKNKPKYPQAKKIIEYSKNQNEDVFFALKVLNNRMFDIIITSDFTGTALINTLNNGKFKKRLREIYYPHFIKIIFSELPSYANRTYNQQFNLLKNKLKKHYGIN